MFFNRKPTVIQRTTVMRCLTCGSIDGDQGDDDGHQSWFWKNEGDGQIGPFCSVVCAKQCRVYLTPDLEQRYTLAEWERLRFYKWSWDKKPAESH